MADYPFLSVVTEIRRRSRFFMERRSMDRELYRAARSGNWNDIQTFDGQLTSQRTAGGNTVLHVVVCNSSEVVKEIFKSKPGLLLEENEEFETALHLAARKGHSVVVRELIDCAKRIRCWWVYGSMPLVKLLLVARNRDGNTALHEAVRSKCYEAVEVLVELGGDRVDWEGETPLFLAVENESYGIASLILSKHNSPSFERPGYKTLLHAGPISISLRYKLSTFGGTGGKTVLHAAALCKFPECEEVIKLILEKLPYLTKIVDECGWTALHYAAKVNHQDVVKLLVSKDKTMAYVSAHEDGLKTALHVAVIHGSLGVAQEILTDCLDCWEMITDERQNILHLAVKNEHNEVLKFILGQPWAADLINQKDIHGNTPLHLYVATKTLLGHDLVNHPGVNRNAFSNKGLTPLQIITGSAGSDEVNGRQRFIKDELEQIGSTPQFRNIVTPYLPGKDEEERWARISGPYMIVATLIVTVTFAAGFTVPGDYDGSNGANKGMAVLAKKAVFTIFVVADSLALLVSISVVFIQFTLSHRPEHWHDSTIQLLSGILIGYAMIAMVVAFVTALFAVIPISGL